MFKIKCAKCESENVKVVKETFGEQFLRNVKNLAFPIRLLFKENRKPVKLYVCGDCGFSREK